MTPDFPPAFRLPCRVEVNRHGPSDDGRDNIFVVDADGSAMAIIAKHPVWKHMEDARPRLAEAIARAINEAYEGAR